jgi:hypothetical protein
MEGEGGGRERERESYRQLLGYKCGSWGVIIQRLYGWVVVLSLWRFDSISGHGLPLLGYTITLTGNTTLFRTALEE